MIPVLLAVGTLVAEDPTAAVLPQCPVHTTRIIPAPATFNCYILPVDAPPEMRRAYSVLEVAEREVELVDRIQRLKAEYVENERRLEAARTAREIFELNSF